EPRQQLVGEPARLPGVALGHGPLRRPRSHPPGPSLHRPGNGHRRRPGSPHVSDPAPARARAGRHVHHPHGPEPGSVRHLHRNPRPGSRRSLRRGGADLVRAPPDRPQHHRRAPAGGSGHRRVGAGHGPGRHPAAPTGGAAARVAGHHHGYPGVHARAHRHRGDRRLHQRTRPGQPDLLRSGAHRRRQRAQRGARGHPGHRHPGHPVRPLLRGRLPADDSQGDPM
ncbi:MAG: ABC transporter, permease protein (cluster 13, osmolytes), partial [uncultured Nocardioidaceae bacterium]